MSFRTTLPHVIPNDPPSCHSERGRRPREESLRSIYHGTMTGCSQCIGLGPRNIPRRSLAGARDDTKQSGAVSHAIGLDCANVSLMRLFSSLRVYQSTHAPILTLPLYTPNPQCYTEIIQLRTREWYRRNEKPKGAMSYP